MCIRDSARIYRFDGTSWTQVGQDIDGESAGDRSGEAVAMSADGNTVIIGAERNDGNGNDSGHARIYSFNGTSWTQVGQDIDGENAGDNSGEGVAISADGNTVIIGALFNDAGGIDSGHVRVFRGQAPALCNGRVVTVFTVLGQPGTAGSDVILSLIHI